MHDRQAIRRIALHGSERSDLPRVFLLLLILAASTNQLFADPHPLDQSGMEPAAVETTDLLPAPEPAPPQFWNNVYYPSLKDEESWEPEESVEVFPLEVNELFPEEAPSQVEMTPIEIPGPPPTAGPFHNVQFPLDQTIGESVEDQFDESSRTAKQGWSPIVLGEANVFSSAMERAGLQWSDQQFSFAIVPQGNGDFGLSTYSFKATTAQDRARFLRITPRFTWHSVSGPLTPDVTSNLYEADLSTTLYLPASDRWAFLVTAAPGLYSDLQNLKSDAIRIVGRGLVFYTWSPELKITGGIVYLDRQDFPLLPALGFVYTPDPDHKYDINFPRPKISVRYQNDSERERWWYVGADLGGGSWAVQRANGEDDILTYRDFRLLVGWEQKERDSVRFRVEAGYAFNRSIEYASSGGEIDLSANGVIQLGFDF